jgi:hypothetical protein
MARTMEVWWWDAETKIEPRKISWLLGLKLTVAQDFGDENFLIGFLRLCSSGDDLWQELTRI